jgi:hypothetical protein
MPLLQCPAANQAAFESTRERGKGAMLSMRVRSLDWERQNVNTPHQIASQGARAELIYNTDGRLGASFKKFQNAVTYYSSTR